MQGKICTETQSYNPRITATHGADGKYVTRNPKPQTQARNLLLLLCAGQYRSVCLIKQLSEVAVAERHDDQIFLCNPAPHLQILRLSTKMILKVKGLAKRIFTRLHGVREKILERPDSL